jgi:hypothetical protein
MAERFATTLDCADISFLTDGTLDALPGLRFANSADVPLSWMAPLTYPIYVLQAPVCRQRFGGTWLLEVQTPPTPKNTVRGSVDGLKVALGVDPPSGDRRGEGQEPPRWRVRPGGDRGRGRPQ